MVNRLVSVDDTFQLPAVVRAALPASATIIDVTKAPYNADPTGAVDATSAINAAFAHAWALPALAGADSRLKPVPVVFGQGTFKISGTINIMTGCDFTQALFLVYMSTGVAVQVGDATGVVQSQPVTYALPHLWNMTKTVRGWAQVAGTVGVRISGLWMSVVWAPHVRGFETNIWVHAHGTGGSAYNEFHFGKCMDAKIGWLIQADSGSWLTRNTYLSGMFSHNPTEGNSPGVVAGTAGMKLANTGGNIFIGLSLESSYLYQYQIDCQGSWNVWSDCWFEADPSIEVIWRTGSYSNQISNGVNASLIHYTFEDPTNTGNFSTAVPLNGFTNANMPQSIGPGGLAWNTDTGRPVFSADGHLIKPVALAQDATILGAVAPEGAVRAPAGSIYARTDTGTYTNLCQYPIASTVAATSGWKSGQTGSTVTAGSGYLRNTVASGTAQLQITPLGLNIFAILPNTEYVFQGEVRSSAATKGAMVVRCYDSSNVQIVSSVTSGPFAQTNASTFVPVTNRMTTPANAAWLLITFQVDPPSTVGDTLDLRRVMWEIGQTQSGYVDGALTSDSDKTYAWTGTPHASTSTVTYTPRPNVHIKTGTGNTGWKELALHDAVTSIAAPPTDLPTGAIAHTFERRGPLSGAAAISGRLWLSRIYIKASTITSISFVSTSTALAGGTHGWFALYSSALAPLMQSTDDTAPVWAANTVKTYTLSSTISVADGWYYIGGSMVATTMPTIGGYPPLTAFTAEAPWLGGFGNTGLTDTAPNPGQTGGTLLAYGFVS